MQRISRLSRPVIVSLRPTLAVLLIATPALAADYQPRETFAPRDMGQAVNAYRSGNGAPGPDYWQNRADYPIQATLDPTTQTLSGEEMIAYTNNSPDALDELWLQLDQNIYRPDSRGGFAAGKPDKGSSDGYVLDEVAIERDGKTTPVPCRSATPAGASRSARRWRRRAASSSSTSATISPFRARSGAGAWAGATPRTARSTSSPNGIRGWRSMTTCAAGTRCRILAQEFYLEYGDFDYASPCPPT